MLALTFIRPVRRIRSETLVITLVSSPKQHLPKHILSLPKSVRAIVPLHSVLN